MTVIGWQRYLIVVRATEVSDPDLLVVPTKSARNVVAIHQSKPPPVLRRSWAPLGLVEA